MIENITYKTKLEDLLNLNELIEIINKYSLNFEKNYSEYNLNNKSIKEEINKINNHIIELAKNQRRKELEKLLEKTTLRINELDETLYNVNEGIKILRSNPNDNDYEQKTYELDQILNLFIDLKTKQEIKRKKIYEQISIL